MFHSGSLLSLSLILAIALVSSFVARRFKKSPTVFYIIFGLLAANFVLRTESSRKLLELLSNLGLIFLLFTIGLEFSLERLKRAGRLIITSGLGQILISGLILSLVVLLFGQNPVVAFFLGFSLAMSSTAVVGKLLQEKGEDSSLSGEITLSTLVIQDIVGVILVTLLTFMSLYRGESTFSLSLLFLQKGLIVVVSFIVLTQLIHQVLGRLKPNREELSLFVFAVIFLLIGLFSNLGIPETTAGFLIGVILMHRVEHYEIFSQVRVFRDVLLVLFFFFLGTYITAFNPLFILLSLVLAVFIMVLKFAIAFVLYVVQGMHQKTAFWTAFDLMQIGEFAFIALTLLCRGGMVSASFEQLLLMVVIWSLIIFSYLYRRKLELYRIFKTNLLGKLPFLSRLSSGSTKMVFDQLTFANHIVLCGYGRVGAFLGHGLVLSKLPLVVIDTNADNIKKLLKRGVKAIYGDATEPDILDYAQVDKAKFLIVSVPNSDEQEQIIMEARHLNPKILIMTRTHLTHELRHLKTLGIQLIFQPEFEAALSMLKRILKFYNLEKEEISKRVHYLKMEHGT